MKKIKSIIPAILIITLFYLIFIFNTLEFNPLKWSDFTRYIFSVATAAITFFYHLFVNMIKEIEK